MSTIKGIRYCNWCNKEIQIFHEERLKHKNNFCCKKCEAEFRKAQSVKNCTCPVCGIKFHVKPSHKNKYKNIFCSMNCKKKYDSLKMKGSGNHQFGLKGELNCSWKSDKKISIYGYNLIRQLDHPLCNCDGFVFEHRLVVESYYLTNENCKIINGKKYLMPNWDVHHIDFDRLNNDKSNLFPLPKTLHQSFHANNKNLSNLSKNEKINRFFDFVKNKEECKDVYKLFCNINQIP